jgi:hypothetical protein
MDICSFGGGVYSDSINGRISAGFVLHEPFHMPREVGSAGEGACAYTSLL